MNNCRELGGQVEAGTPLPFGDRAPPDPKPEVAKGAISVNLRIAVLSALLAVSGWAGISDPMDEEAAHIFVVHDTDGFANVRSGPSADSAVIGRIQRGTPIYEDNAGRLANGWWMLHDDSTPLIEGRTEPGKVYSQCTMRERAHACGMKACRYAWIMGEDDLMLPEGIPTVLELISLGMALIFGTAGLPHILVRFYTVPDAKTARYSVVWAMVIIGSFYIMTTFLGFGAATIVGRDFIAKNGGTNMSAPLLAA